MNADTLEAIAKVIAAVDAATAEHGLTLYGSVKVSDVGGADAICYLSFNCESETTMVAA